MSKEFDPLLAALSSIADRMKDDDVRREEIYETITRHHGAPFVIAAKALLYSHHSSLSILGLTKAFLPDMIGQLLAMKLSDLCETDGGAMMRLAAEQTMPGASREERIAVAKKVQKLLEPLMEQDVKSTISNGNQFAEAAMKVFKDRKGEGE